MFHWSFTEEVETHASAEQVWSVWQDVQAWPSWDPEIESAQLFGTFKESTKGSLKLKNGQVVAFQITEIKKNHKFVDIANLPLTRMKFSHTYKSLGGKFYISHHVSMHGLLAPFFGFVIGCEIKKSLKNAMMELSKKAESI